MGESACMAHAFSYSSALPGEITQGTPIHALGDSISLGRFAPETLSWERWSAFTCRRYVEEAQRFSQPGSVAKKKAFFEAHYKTMAAKKRAEEENVTFSPTPFVEHLEDKKVNHFDATKEEPLDRTENGETQNLVSETELRTDSESGKEEPAVSPPRPTVVLIEEPKVEAPPSEMILNPESLQELIYLNPVEEPDKSAKVAPSPDNAPKVCRTPLKVLLMASDNGELMHPSSTPCPENKRPRSSPESPALGSKKRGQKHRIRLWFKSLIACGNKSLSPISSHPLSFSKTGERAERRKQEKAGKECRRTEEREAQRNHTSNPEPK
ncbi:hypothetical protein NMG60_11026665 [Bertholletia excelsa]